MGTSASFLHKPGASKQVVVLQCASSIFVEDIVCIHYMYKHEPGATLFGYCPLSSVLTPTCPALGHCVVRWWQFGMEWYATEL